MCHLVLQKKPSDNDDGFKTLPIQSDGRRGVTSSIPACGDCLAAGKPTSAVHGSGAQHRCSTLYNSTTLVKLSNPRCCRRKGHLSCHHPDIFLLWSVPALRREFIISWRGDNGGGSEEVAVLVGNNGNNGNNPPGFTQWEIIPSSLTPQLPADAERSCIVFFKVARNITPVMI